MKHLFNFSFFLGYVRLRVIALSCRLDLNVISDRERVKLRNNDFSRVLSIVRRRSNLPVGLKLFSDFQGFDVEKSFRSCITVYN